MASELTIINNAPIAHTGVNTDSKWFKNIKPSTLTLVQKLSKVPEDVKVGNLYVKDFNAQFKEMRCVLISEPGEQRQYYIGAKGELNKRPENLGCFSYDLVRPHPDAKLPQAMLCANCDKGDWGPFNEYKKENNGKVNRDLIPPCEKDIRLLLLDTKLKMPLRMYLSSMQKAPFEEGMENIAKLILMKKAEGQDPSIYDVSFRLSSKIVQKGPFTNYVPTFTDARYITEEEKAEFGAALKLFTRSATADVQEELQTTQTEPTIAEVEYVRF